VYQILWRDREGGSLACGNYPSVADAVKSAEHTQEMCSEFLPVFDIVFAANGRIVPDWFRQMELEKASDGGESDAAHD
jgi:hypothetical protein